MADQDEQHSLFHDLGKHVSDAIGDFVNARQKYGQENPPQSPEDISAGKLPDAVTANTDPNVVYGANSPVQPAPQQASMVQPMAQPAVAQQPMQAPQQPMSQPDAGQGSQGLPGPLKAEANLAKAQQGAGDEIQNIYDQGLTKQKQLVDDTQTHYNANRQADQQLIQAYQDHKLDPNHVINNMSTGSKIMTSLGLLFSGIGSGLTGQKNLALEMINNNIARDLEAQKAAQGQAYNAYQMHREGTKDEYVADLQHQKDNMIAIDAAIEQQKAKLMGPQAVAAATQTQLALRNQILDLNQKSAMWQATKQALSGASQSGPSTDVINNNRWQQLKLSGLLKGEDETAATKEAGNYKEAESLRKDMESSAQHLDSQVLAGALHPSDRQSAINAFAGRIAKVGEGRFNLEESKLQAQALLPSPLDSKSTVQNKAQRRQQFFDSLAATPTLDRLGLKNQPQQESQPQFKVVNGVKYRRGPNGEAVKVQ